MSGSGRRPALAWYIAEVVGRDDLFSWIRRCAPRAPGVGRYFDQCVTAIGHKVAAYPQAGFFRASLKSPVAGVRADIQEAIVRAQIGWFARRAVMLEISGACAYNATDLTESTRD